MGVLDLYSRRQKHLFAGFKEMSIQPRPDATVQAAIAGIDDVKGSDATFTAKAKELFTAIITKVEVDNPGLKPGTPEFKAKMEEVAGPMIDKAAGGKELAQQAADILKASLKNAKDADEFAALMLKDRDKVAAAIPGGNDKASDMSEKMLQVLIAILEKMFGGNLGLSQIFGDKAKPQDTKPAAPAATAQAPQAAPAGAPQAAPDDFGPPVMAATAPAPPAGAAPAVVVAAAAAPPQRLPTEQEELAAMIKVPDRPASEFAGSIIRPQTFEQAFAVKPEPFGPVTYNVALQAVPAIIDFDKAGGSLAAVFKQPSNPPPESVVRVDPKEPPVTVVAQIDEPKLRAQALGFGT